DADFRKVGIEEPELAVVKPAPEQAGDADGDDGGQEEGGAKEGLMPVGQGMKAEGKQQRQPYRQWDGRDRKAEGGPERLAEIGVAEGLPVIIRSDELRGRGREHLPTEEAQPQPINHRHDKKRDEEHQIRKHEQVAREPIEEAPLGHWVRPPAICNARCRAMIRLRLAVATSSACCGVALPRSAFSTALLNSV